MSRRRRTSLRSAARSRAAWDKSLRRRSRAAGAARAAAAATAAAVSVAGTATAATGPSVRSATGVAALAECAVSTPSGAPRALARLGDTLFFTANDGTRGRELWKSDGTEAGTMLVKNIKPDTARNPGSTPRNLTAVGDILYFSADDGTRGRELWRTDGTRAGTVLVKDVHPRGSGRPQELTARRQTLFFAADDGRHSVELWKSDGTAAGTVLVKDIAPPGGDYAGSYPSDMVTMGRRIYFASDDGEHGRELWRSNGRRAGTVLVKDIDPKVADDHPHYPGSDPSYLTKIGDRLFFAADNGTVGAELWGSDGSRAGTLLIKDIDPGGKYSSSSPRELRAMGGRLFFAADDGTRGRELWRSDGTSTGTVLVKNIDPDSTGYGGSYPGSLTPAGGRLFFSASSGGSEGLWKSDGSTGGTVEVADVAPAEDYGSPYQALTAMQGHVFFAADDSTHGEELWESDGTTPGTAMVQDINPCESGYYRDSRPSSLTARGSLLFFAADDGSHGDELWVSDGTPEGTELVKDIRP